MKNKNSKSGKELLRLKKEFQKSFTKVFKEEIQSFFNAFPNAYSISWRQYTPYFNDGEACEFSKPDLDSFDIGLINPEDKEDLLDPVCFYDFEDEKLEKQMKKDLSWFNDIEDEYFRILFGDHVQVTISSNMQVTVEDYKDHD